MIKGITFDCWDTILVDDESLNTRIMDKFIHLLEKYGYDMNKKKMTRLFNEEEEEYRFHVVEEKKTRDSLTRTEAILKLAGAHIPEDAVSEIALYADSIALDLSEPSVPGIEEALAKLSKKYTLAVICNTGWHSGKVVRELLERNKLAGYFQQLIFSDEAEMAKPNRQIFIYTLEKIGVSPREAVHIGDSQYSDIIGAGGAGMKTVLFAGINKQYKNENSADITINSYKDLPKIIEKLQV